jgi:hypothetical protein
MRKIDSKLEFTQAEWDDFPAFLAIAILKRWKHTYAVVAAPGVEIGKLREWMVGTIIQHFPVKEVVDGKVVCEGAVLHHDFIVLSDKLSLDLQKNFVITSMDVGEVIVDRFNDWTYGQVFLAKRAVIDGLLAPPVAPSPPTPTP